MSCEHEATLAKPTKYMLMGSTGAADLILPLSMVASLRHQSIINTNEIKDSTITWKDPTTPWNNFFLGCFWNLWDMNSRTQFSKCINYLPGKGGTGGLIYLRDASCSLLSLCPRDPRDSIARTVHNHIFTCVINLTPPFFYFMSHLVPFPLVLPPIFYKTKPLVPPWLSFERAQDAKWWTRDASGGTLC
jgi:hypothetical protein